MGLRKSPLRDKIESTNIIPLYDQAGRYRLGDTLIANGIQSNGHARKILRDKLNAEGHNRFHSDEDTFVPGCILSSMKLGESVLDIGWQATQGACVYAIVCEGSGRMYIGASRQPDRRRAVHHYWLKRYWQYGTSNVYFGSKKVAEDVRKFGVDNFQLEILKSMPDATDAELKEAENELINSYPKEVLYNRQEITTSSYKKSIFYNLEPDLVIQRTRLFEQIALFEDLRKYYVIFKNSIPELKEDLRKQYKAGKFSNHERAITSQSFYQHLLDIGRQKRQAHYEMQRQIKQLQYDIEQIKLKYQTAEYPLY